MNDQHDLESDLRDHFARRAAAVEARPAVGGALAVAEEARCRRAARHRRRMATASVATAAAVAAGLVVIARDPGQDVRTERNGGSASNQGLAAGAATGSSTGTSTGSPTGWTAVPESAQIPPSPVTLRAPAGFQPTEPYLRGIQQGPTGERAADLAVAADAESGAPLRFVVASVQDAARLSPGTGGTTVTIGGRPGRVISRRAAVTLTWDLSATERVLVTAAGVTDADLDRWLTSLTRNADGHWTFDAAAAPTDLVVIPTVTPNRQWSRTSSWQRVSPDDPCDVAGYDLTTSSGGSYELWARLAEDARWSDRVPELRSGAVTGVPLDSPFFVTQWGGLYVMSGDAVVQVSHWGTGLNGGASDAAQLDELISLLTAPTSNDPSTPTTPPTAPPTTSVDQARECKQRAASDSEPPVTAVDSAADPTAAPATTVAGG